MQTILQCPGFFAGFAVCLILIAVALLLFLTFAPLTAAECAPWAGPERRRWRPARAAADRQAKVAERALTGWDDQNDCPRAPR